MKSLSLLTLTMVSLSISASTVTWRNLRLSIVTEMPEGYTVSYQFSKCMANDLFTFSQVLMDDIIVNSATSDNIGPFLLSGGWTGGNHLMPDNTTHSAETTSIQVVVDGDTLNANATLNAQKVVINVSNNIYNPSKDAELFCIEKIKYTVVGNSIQVEAQHLFCNPSPMVVSRYYGMQSMAIGETAILTPEGGAYNTWTPIGSIDRFTKISAPKFHQFIEKMPTCYQASYMLPEGLGTHYLIQDNDVVFIGNSYGKSYHKLMGNATVTNGETTTWKGIYTWFKTPITDEVDGTFSYRGYKDGNEVVFSSSPPNEDVIEDVSEINEVTENKDKYIFATASNGQINVSKDVKYVKCYSINGQFVARGSGSLFVPAGLYILKDDNDHVLKLSVN